MSSSKCLKGHDISIKVGFVLFTVSVSFLLIIKLLFIDSIRFNLLSPQKTMIENSLERRLRVFESSFSSSRIYYTEMIQFTLNKNILSKSSFEKVF